MKKALSLILALALCLSLCACGSKVKPIIERIEALNGNVTLESGPFIEQAEAEYNALSEKDKSKVTNYAVLVSARAQCDELLSKSTNVVNQIDELPELSAIKAEDRDNILDVLEAYEALTDKEKEKVTNADKLNISVETVNEIAANEDVAEEPSEPEETKEPDFSEELTFGVWKRVLVHHRSFSFYEDGTGTENPGDSFKWRMSGTTISLVTSENEEITMTADYSKGYARLVTTDGFVYVKEENYIAEREDVISQLSAQADVDNWESDWFTMINDARANPSKAAQDYMGKLITFVAVCPILNDGDINFGVMNTEIMASMDTDMIATLDSDKTYTCMGYIDFLDPYFVFISHCFIVE